MKNLFLSIAIVLTSIFSYAQEEEKGITITVTIDNVKSDNGKVSMALHTSETFMKGAGVMNAETKIKDGKISITFENVKPGEYAIMALHDENENNRMDFRENGMPLESYGTSNNVMAFGPPQYDDAKFKVEDKDLELNIRF
ncbi:DUF2141 domain-containing protein [Winogradskyella echinorum]|uniref:DUF2141 domain-containing protein n=1 Tax=Winogradskyella echinorum TaxID=538189 RepID=A0ABR6Y292_9FLAO|nr:DUF2141 domain-containing protein [Winogradskyella echinorum]MBC3846861.1 DUF2141 domain-containing protein [Winogradskyella echinorum]MBC5751209.1 DUF2141 domain-containing protein [Winogradskyella echinorum]